VAQNNAAAGGDREITMCLALPANVLAIDTMTDMAIVSLGGVRKDVSLALVDNDVRVDDFVMIPVGYALNKLSEEEAERTLQLFAEAGLTAGGAA
jgi:hydrogenase expression/formation protein HypC